MVVHFITGPPLCVTAGNGAVDKRDTDSPLNPPFVFLITYLLRRWKIKLCQTSFQVPGHAILMGNSYIITGVMIKPHQKLFRSVLSFGSLLWGKFLCLRLTLWHPCHLLMHFVCVLLTLSCFKYGPWTLCFLIWSWFAAFSCMFM